MTKATKEREIVVTRVIDAPRELVFAAFTEREHAEQWWLPKGAETKEWNGEPGGAWRYGTAEPGGRQNTFKVTFIELNRPERLVYDYESEAQDGSQPVRTSVTFEDEDGKTRVTLELLFASAAERKMAVKYGAIVGAMQALESLGEYVESL